MTSREFMYMNKNVFTFVSIGFRAFCKIGIATKRLYVCNPCTAHTVLHTNIGVRLWAG